MELSVFKKAKLAAAIALTSSTMLMTGCLVEGDDSESESLVAAAVGNNSVNTSAPIGKVQGDVKDTNGQPVVGATVYIGSRSTVTSTGGTYEFEGVEVSSLVVTQDGTYLDGEIRITIVPPEGYLGATVEVYPSAVIDQGRTDQGTDTETSSSSTNRFIDGFTASAGEAVLPIIGENGATVSGVLRDYSTGEALSNQSINLELIDVNGNDVANDSDGDAISYTSISFPATTDAEGNFSIEGAPTDSDLVFIVGGYSVVEVDTNNYGSNGVVTDDEVEVIHVGNVLVSEITNADDISPYVIAIEEAAMNGNRAKLHDDVTNTLNITFSESIQADKVDENSVVVRDVTAGEYISVAASVSANNRTLTLVATNNFTAGNELDIYLLKVDFQDTASNTLDEDSNITSNNISYDYDNVNDNEDFLNLQVEVFRNLLQDAAVVTNFSQLTEDDSSERSVNELDLASSAFADVDKQAVANGIQQLNSTDSDVDPDINDADNRLTQLIAALDLAGIVDNTGTVQLDDNGEPVTDGIGLNDGVETNVARVSFTPSNAAYYRYWVLDGNDAVETNIEIDDASSPDAQTIDTTSNFSVLSSGAGFGIIGAKDDSDFSDFASTNVAFLVRGVAPGQTIYVQSMDEFGNEGSVTSVVLADNVAATTGLQDAYEELDLQSSSTIFGEQYGNGAELANPDAVALVGLPLLNINSGMLADQDIVTDSTPDLSNLYESNFSDEENNNEAYISANSEIYDKTAYDAWSQLASRTIAVSFTENLAWTVADADDTNLPAALENSPTTDAVTELTGWTIMNDITVASDGHAVNADLIALDVEDIFSLANTDGQAARVIDFTGQIQDAAGNISQASANAKVVINDSMPPMVTEAVYNGSNLTITFNEDVMLDPSAGSIVVTLGGTPVVMDVNSKAEHNSKTVNRNTLVIPFTIDGVDDLLELNRTPVFSLGDYNEDGLASAAAGSGNHAELNFENIQDVFGNSWAEDNANLSAPAFAAYDNLGQIVGTATPTSLTAGLGLTTAITITYTFTHAIDINDMLGQSFGEIDENTNITGAQIASIMSLANTNGGTAAIDTTNTMASINLDGTELTVSLRTVNSNLVNGDTLDFIGNVPSLWDSVDTVNVQAVETP